MLKAWGVWCRNGILVLRCPWLMIVWSEWSTCWETDAAWRGAAFHWGRNRNRREGETRYRRSVQFIVDVLTRECFYTGRLVYDEGDFTRAKVARK